MRNKTCSDKFTYVASASKPRPLMLLVVWYTDLPLPVCSGSKNQTVSSSSSFSTSPSICRRSFSTTSTVVAAAASIPASAAFFLVIPALEGAEIGGWWQEVMREDRGETVVGGGPLESVEEGELEAEGRMMQWERESGVIRDRVDAVCISLPPPLSVWPRLPTVEEIFGEVDKCTGRVTSWVKANGGR